MHAPVTLKKLQKETRMSTIFVNITSSLAASIDLAFNLVSVPKCFLFITFFHDPFIKMQILVGIENIREIERKRKSFCGGRDRTYSTEVRKRNASFAETLPFCAPHCLVTACVKIEASGWDRTK